VASRLLMHVSLRLRCGSLSGRAPGCGWTVTIAPFGRLTAR